MHIFRGSKDIWFVITENSKEKKKLFELIPRRNPAVYYYHPQGQRHEQFQITPQEADLINKNWRNDP